MLTWQKLHRTAAFLGKRITQKNHRNLSLLQCVPAVCPATLEAFTTNKRFAARRADLGGQWGRGAAIWPGRLTLLPALYSHFPSRYICFTKGMWPPLQSTCPKGQHYRCVQGGGENRENRCAGKGEGGYIQADQTKWPLMLSLLVPNQMTLQQELLSRMHKSVCVREKASI